GCLIDFAKPHAVGATSLFVKLAILAADKVLDRFATPSRVVDYHAAAAIRADQQAVKRVYRVGSTAGPILAVGLLLVDLVCHPVKEAHGHKGIFGKHGLLGLYPILFCLCCAVGRRPLFLYWLLWSHCFYLPMETHAHLAPSGQADVGGVAED